MLKTNTNRDLSVTYFLLNFEDLWEPIFYLILNIYGICNFRMLESSPHWETCSLSFETNLIKVSLYNLKKLWNKRFYFSLINKRSWHHHHYYQPAPKSFVDGRSIWWQEILSFYFQWWNQFRMVFSWCDLYMNARSWIPFVWLVPKPVI